MTEPEESDPFLDLDWTTLEDWAGTKTLSRGRQYQRDGRVHELVRSQSGSVVAWVDGTERYATAVYFDNDDMRSVCTCPVGSGCKHAVAVLWITRRIVSGSTILGQTGRTGSSTLGTKRVIIPKEC